MTNKQVNFLKFIKHVSKPFSIESEFTDSLEIVHTLYDYKWRHSYSLITKYLLSDVSKEALNEVLVQIVDNLERLKKSVQEECNDEHTKQSNIYCRRSIEKLIDHINLEAVRLDYYHWQKEELHALINNNIKENNELNQKIKEHKLLVEKLEKRFDEQQTQSITILGIFASIVLSFVCGFSLFTSVFSNMDKVSTPKLFVLTCILITAIVDLMSYLYFFLIKIKNSKAKYDWCIWIPFNLIMLACVVSTTFYPNFIKHLFN